jgi:uncharacterized membrane protein YfcA
MSIYRNAHPFLVFGLIGFALGVLFGRIVHNDSIHWIADFVIGLSVVFMIAGLIKSRRSSPQA